MTSLVTARGVSKHFGEVRAVDDVSFEIDADGLVRVSASDASTGRTQNIEVKPSSGLTPEEVNKIIKRSESPPEETESDEQA